MDKILKNKGITLVALVITIIILLVLAGITINALSGENGLIAKVNQAKKAHIKAEMKEKLVLAINKLQLEKEGKATLDDIMPDWADNNLTDYKSTIITDASISGKKIIMQKNGVTGKYIIDANLNITEIENDSSIEFSYEVGKRTGNKVGITIHVQDKENGLSMIELPDEDPMTVEGDKKREIGIDCDVEIDKEYKVKIISENGQTREETILITDYWYDIRKNLGEGVEIKDTAIKAAYNKPYQTKITVGNEYILETLTVTMDGQAVTTAGNNIVNIETGEIYIEKVTGDIVITATALKMGDSLLDENLLQGEVELKNLDKIVSNEIIKTPKTFILSIEAKFLKHYYKEGTPSTIGRTYSWNWSRTAVEWEVTVQGYFTMVITSYS